MQDQKEKIRKQFLIYDKQFLIYDKKKNLVINLPKKAKDLYSEIQKILMKEIKGDKKQMAIYTMFLDWKN